MTMSITKKAASMIAASTFALLFAAATASAQQPQTVRVRGTIEKVDGQVLTVKARDGTSLTVKLADNAPVRTVVQRSLADVKQGTFVGITAMPQPDGTQKAVEIHIFPESMRGVGEGFRPFDMAPGSTMTNGNVNARVERVDGPTIVVAYAGGQQSIAIDQSTPIVALEPGTLGDLTAGAAIVARGAPSEGGGYQANRIVVGVKGVVPPM